MANLILNRQCLNVHLSRTIKWNSSRAFCSSSWGCCPNLLSYQTASCSPKSIKKKKNLTLPWMLPKEGVSSISSTERYEPVVCGCYWRHAFPGGAVDKESTCNAGDSGDMGLIPGSGRFPWEGNGYLPTILFLLENPRDRGPWWAAVHGVSRQTWLSANALLAQKTGQTS